MKSRVLSTCVLCAAFALRAGAQTAPTVPHETKTFPLIYATSPQEENETVTALRNMLDASMRVFFVPSAAVVVVSGTPEQVKQAGVLLQQLDLKKSLYRVTYTFTESDGGKRVGLQRYSMMMSQGQHAKTKQGSRVPIVTSGLVNSEHHEDRSYLDVGINIDSDLQTYGDGGVRLNGKIEESSLAEEKSGLGPEDPIIRQTLLEGTSMLTVGKPQAFGSLDIVGSTRHIDVEVLVELVK